MSVQAKIGDAFRLQTGASPFRSVLHSTHTVKYRSGSVVTFVERMDLDTTYRVVGNSPIELFDQPASLRLRRRSHSTISIVRVWLYTQAYLGVGLGIVLAEKSLE